MNTYYVYILASGRNGTLYIGITNNLERRMYEHKNHLYKGFSDKYDVTNLMYYEETPSVEVAIAREKRLKQFPGQWKINLIEKDNPAWRDLVDDFLLDSAISAE